MKQHNIDYLKMCIGILLDMEREHQQIPLAYPQTVRMIRITLQQIVSEESSNNEQSQRTRDTINITTNQ